MRNYTGIDWQLLPCCLAFRVLCRYPFKCYTGCWQNKGTNGLTQGFTPHTTRPTYLVCGWNSGMTVKNILTASSLDEACFTGDKPCLVL